MFQNREIPRDRFLSINKPHQNRRNLSILSTHHNYSMKNTAMFFIPLREASKVGKIDESVIRDTLVQKSLSRLTKSVSVAGEFAFARLE